ncbi:MAG TPA: tetratricopeptide repeat protein [Blastocatellia bacterium]
MESALRHWFNALSRDRHGERANRCQAKQTPNSAICGKVARLLLNPRLLGAFLLALLFTAPATCQVTGSTSGHTYALVIGVSQYSKLPGGQQLQYAENDARAFANTLQSVGGVDLRNMWLLAGAGATQTAIKTALGSWLARQTSAQDTVYIFFSGHGIVDREFGASYWLAYDSDPKNVDATAISVDDLKHALGSRVKAGRIFIIQDSVRRDLFDPDSNGPADAAAFEKAFSDLAQSRPGLSCLIASGPNEFSREGHRWKDMGVFTRLIVDGLAGRADRNKDGVITDEELFEWLSERIPQETTDKQHPWRTSGDYTAIAMSSPRSRPMASGTSPGAGAQPAPSSTGAGSSTDDGGAKSKAEAGSTGQQSPSFGSKPSTSVGSLSGGSSRSSSAAPSKDSATGSTPNSGVTGSPKPLASGSGASTGEAPVPVADKPKPPPMTGSVPVVSAPSKQADGPVPIAEADLGKAPSPLPSQLEEAIAAGRLIEPKESNAWDLYQRIALDSSPETARLKDLLANALLKSSKSIVEGDALEDSLRSDSDDFKRAGDMLARLQTLRPGDKSIVVLRKLSDIEGMIAIEFYSDAEKALADLPAPATGAVENAHGLIYIGQLSDWQAERSFKRAIAADPNLAAPHYNLALLYKGQGNDQALAELETAGKLAPENVRIQTTLGDEYLARSRWAEATVAYKQAITVDPNNDSLHTKLANSLYSQGLREEADREYKRARDLAAKNR